MGNLDIIDDRPLKAPLMEGALKLNLKKFGAEMGRSHGNIAGDLVDNPPFGVSPAVTWSVVANLTADNDKEDWNSNLIRGLEAAAKSPTRLVTASVGYFGESPTSAIDRFVNEGKLFVQASGNDYPQAWRCPRQVS